MDPELAVEPQGQTVAAVAFLDVVVSIATLAVMDTVIASGSSMVVVVQMPLVGVHILIELDTRMDSDTDSYPSFGIVAAS